MRGFRDAGCELFFGIEKDLQPETISVYLIY